MATRKSLEIKIQQAQVKLRAAEAALTKHLQRNVMVICGWSPPHGRGCGKKTPIGKLTYHQSHWMTGEPYDDTPKEGEGFTICPKCGQILRFIKNTGNEKMPEYKYLFKDIIDEDPD